MNKLRRLYIHCRLRGIPVDPHVAAVAIRAVGSYSATRDRYYSEIEKTIAQYLSGTGTVALPKGHIKREMATAFVDAFETGWMETAGGDTYEPESEDISWLASRTSQELGFIDSLFVSMKEMRDSSTKEDPLTSAEIYGYAADKAVMYSRTLDLVNAQGMLRGGKNVMLTFDGEDGKESCATCQKYKGQRHRAKWWVSRDLIPGPGNTNYECNGYNCMHELQDDDGEMWAGSVQSIGRGGPGSGRYPAGSGDGEKQYKMSTSTTNKNITVVEDFSHASRFVASSSIGEEKINVLANELNSAIEKYDVEEDVDGVKVIKISEQEGFIGTASFVYSNEPGYVSDEIWLMGGWLNKSEEGRTESLLHEIGHRAQLITDTNAFKEFTRLGLGKFFTKVTDSAFIKNYSSKQRAGETFAESYARFKMGRDMPGELVSFWEGRK